MTTLVRHNGTRKLLQTPIKRDELTGYMLGDFEIIPLGSGNIAVCSTDHTTENEVASAMAGRHLFGNVVFCNERELHADCGLRT